MIKLAIASIVYPVTMAKFFIDEFDSRDDVELFTLGPFTGDWLPWGGGMHLPQRYVKTPDLALPQSMINQWTHPAIVDNALPWTPDLFLSIDAGWSLSQRPKGKIVARIKTDPHCLADHYSKTNYWNFQFSMQSPYLVEGDIFLPYAVDPYIHYPMDLEKETDVCMIGLKYTQREQTVNALRSRGISVDYRLGVVYDEYREAYNKSRVALSWSSLLDTPSRVFEAFGMKIPLVTNRLPDLEWFFVEDDDYLGFSNVEEAVEKVEYALSHDMGSMVESAYKKVMNGHLYSDRVNTILETVGLI